MSWGTPIRITGTTFQVEFTADLTPVENSTILVQISKALGYSSGQSVLVISKSNPSNVFEAIVTSYSATTGWLALEQITNIKGSTFGDQIYILNLAGERGKSMFNGTTGPSNNVGRPGDMFLDTITGDLYIKS